MIDESAPITGPAYDLNRWHKYKGAVDWKLHSVYFKHEIYRGYWKRTGKATSMHGSMHDGMLVLGGNLDTIVPLIERRGGYDTGYRAMIRTEDISMIQVKKVIE